MNWISVKDQLPKDKQAVLVIDENGKMYSATGHPFDAIIDKDLAFTTFFCDCCYRHPPVTHWMPIPKGPGSTQ